MAICKDALIKPRPTKRQAKVLSYMKLYQAENGAPPSLREISVHFRWSSMNSARDHVKALEVKGLVKHHGRRSRCWVAL